MRFSWHSQSRVFLSDGAALGAADTATCPIPRSVLPDRPLGPALCGAMAAAMAGQNFRIAPTAGPLTQGLGENEFEVLTSGSSGAPRVIRRGQNSWLASFAVNQRLFNLVITSDPSNMLGVVFNPLFDYHPMFVAASNNPLAQKTFITAEDFRDQLLITYPVARDKLDVFTEVLNPAKIEPRATRQVELTAMILMLVAANRGVSVLPDWVLRDVRSNADFVTLPLGPHPVVKRLYAATRAEDATKPYMAQFLRLSRSEPVKLQRNL